MFSSIIFALVAVFIIIFFTQKTKSELETEIRKISLIKTTGSETIPISDSSAYVDSQKLKDLQNKVDENQESLIAKIQDLSSAQAGDRSFLQTGIDVLNNQVLKAGGIFVTNADATDVDIKNSFNIASIVFNGSGNYTINFASPMDTVPIISTGFQPNPNDVASISLYNITTTSFTMEYRVNGNIVDNKNYLCFTCHTVAQTLTSGSSA